MIDFPEDEVRSALNNYLKVREGIENGEANWDALADCFTDDATYIDPAWGRFVGKQAIAQFQRESMSGLEDWSFPIEWITIDGNRIIIKFWNRLPGKRADGTFYQAPGFQEIIYAGNGKFSYDEDLLNMVHVMELIEESGWIPGPEIKLPSNIVR